jgi:hypothetical protein
MKNNFLDKLGFTTTFGLVHDLGEAQNHVERLYIEEAKRLSTPAHAVYFRRFYKNEADGTPYSSTPAVCIFHKSDGFFNTEPHKTLHAELWSAGKTEMYIILGETRVDIINARRPAKRDGKDVTLDHKDLALARKAIQNFEDARFSAHLFGSGTFWEQSDFQDKIDGNSNPYSFLLDYLMDVRKQLLKDDSIGELKAVTIDKLLITSILIKFLEEIKNDDGKHTLKDIYKNHNLETETFEEGLRNGKCLSILADLAREFNGKIFDTFSEEEEKEEKEKISKANLSSIANFLSTNTDVRTNQIFMWEQYSFKHLPAEVISAIYENFIQAEAERNDVVRKDVVYTPLHLVNLMIDEAMPLDQPELFDNQIFKVLDPACGSGVFLVAAYKRMLQWWAINQWKKTGEIVYPDKETAKNILEQNIFGVDIEKVAALVSIFGLTTAFLDKLTPKEIWNGLKFKDLSEQNIQGLNFTDWAKPAMNRKECFDLVIGNPPFNPSSKGTVTDKDLKDLFGKKVPDNNLALKFFEAALYFGKKVCMIIPSNAFLYNKSNPSHEYRKEIFTNYTVDKIFDFTHLRRDLFHKTADTPVIALLVQNTPSTYEAIEHIVVKRQLLSERKIRFEIDYYDKHRVRWDWAVDEKKQFIWKTNLLGGGRLFHLVYRLSLLETLEQFLEEKKKKNKWLYNVGYITNHSNKDKSPASYITGEKTIKPKSFDEFGNFDTITENSKSFVEIRKKELFENPHIVCQLVAGKYKIPMAFINDHLCFNSSFVGISAPKEDEKELYKIYERLHKEVKTSDLYRAYILANSSKAGVYHETSIVKEDIDNLPYPQDEEYLEASDYESIIINDVLKHYRHLGKAITKKHDGHILHEPITEPEPELLPFGKIYCDVLNEIYAEDGKSWQVGEVLQTPTFISYQFGFGKDGGLHYDFKVDAEKDLNSLLDNIKSNSGIHYKRIIRHYQHVDGYDCVYLIKPNARRYWLQSIALRDADDTFMDLKKSGY